MKKSINVYQREMENFRKLNQVADANGVVLFGSSFAKDIPVCELKQTFHMDCSIYNRSLADLSVFHAEKLLDDCVIGLSPKKVLLQLGETDLEQGHHTIPEIIHAYEKLIAKLKSADKHCKIVIVSVCENASGICPDEFNQALERMAQRTKCRYADISPAFSYESPCIQAFRLLKFFMIDRISFCDAVAFANA